MKADGFSISIIVPVYNVENYIEECILSIIAQTYTNFECIIVDDCGTAKSMEIVKSIVDNYNGSIEFVLLRNEKNQGVSLSRNNGIKVAKGDYLYFLDSDDKLYPDSLSNLIEKVKKYKNVDLVQGNIVLENSNDYRANILRFNKDSFPECIDDSSVIQRTMLHWSYPPTATNKLIRRSFLVDNNLYFLEGIVHEDEHWRWLLHKYIKCLVFDYRDIYWYRTISVGSIMNIPDMTKSFVSKIKILEYIALHGNTQNDVCYAIHFLNYQTKISNWDQISNKALVNEQIIKTLKLLKSKGCDYRYIQHLNILRLPVCLINNRVFAKLYYEYEKRNNLTYSFS